VPQILKSGEVPSASEPLRILHVIPSLALGGAEQMAAHLMIGLSRSHIVGAVGLFEEADNPVERRLAEAGIPKWHLNKRSGFDPRMFGSLRRIFRDFRPDVVHTHMATQRYVFPLLLTNRVAAALHTVHSLAEYETDAFGRLINWFAFRNQVLPVGVSQEVSASVERVYGLECKGVILNCIPVEQYQGSNEDRDLWRDREGIERDAIVFTCVGRLELPKNPSLLLEAFRELNDSRAHLVLSGDGSLREQLQSYARAHKLCDRVHLIGKQNDVPSVLAASDVFVLGSNWEGNPLAVMEAMAAGLPVIATQVGGIPELVRSGDQGLLVPAGDRTEFAAAMRTLLNDVQMRRAMGRAARTRAMREFRVERMVEGYENLYREMVKKSRGKQPKAVARCAASQT
jgi:glycosyltransferase involved in cell wall biosynthesis